MNQPSAFAADFLQVRQTARYQQKSHVFSVFFSTLKMFNMIHNNFNRQMGWARKRISIARQINKLQMILFSK
ncbi:hypothetical protein NNRS527_02602 [Nitrosospira sp. NRS527]|nr:hypothetical protein NNRS527_02602 [Nitrosospira sp. NRS527]